jgi:hypothetical protein
MARLRAGGEVQARLADIRDLPDPIEIDRGQELPSVSLARLRRDER